MWDLVLQYIRERALLHAGDRVAVAVSGGADSVALLRVLLELRAELGIVLSVAHFNHGLRGDEANADEAFVADLAKHHRLEFFVGHGDVRDHALTSKLSIEAAGRELRYRWFAVLAEERRLDAIATAHTLDDQAETVILKFLRGAGTRGLAGVYPDIAATGTESPPAKGGCEVPLYGIPFQSPIPSARVIRPLLCISRQEVEKYLTVLGQSWREDESNLDRRFSRNRVRRELLPLLEREFNPNIRQAMSDLAEIARGEQAFWQKQVSDELTSRLQTGQSQVETGGGLDLEGFEALPLALQRRLLKGFAEQHRLTLDFEHIERLRRCALGELSKSELPGGRVAEKIRGSLCFREPFVPQDRVSYHYVLPIPGKAFIAELALTLRAEPVPAGFVQELTPGDLLSLDSVGSELTVRNWMPGDRFWPAHSGSAEKLKRLFAEKRIPAADRQGWPVVLRGDEIVWVHGFPVAIAYQWKGEGPALRIEAIPD